LATGWLNEVEMGSLGVECVWNGVGLGGEILIFGRELGLDMLNSGVGMGKGVELVEIEGNRRGG
jgi:hypothetical protein